VAIALALPVVVAAEADLRRRSPEQVRGNKRLWQLACTNALPALLYLLIGRRETPAGA